MTEPLVALLVAALAWLCVGGGFHADPMSFETDRAAELAMPFDVELDGDGPDDDLAGGWALSAFSEGMIPEPQTVGRVDLHDERSAERPQIRLLAGRGPPHRLA